MENAQPAAGTPALEAEAIAAVKNPTAIATVVNAVVDAAPDIKYIATAVLFGVWCYLVVTGKAPADDFVNTIKLTITGFAAYHAGK